MIIIFEQDKRDHGKGAFNWRVGFFKRPWRNGGHSRRFCWGLWSVSLYPEPGLKDFFDYIGSGGTTWM